MPPMVSPTLTHSSLAGFQSSKSKNKIHVSFTDWVLGGSLLSINSSPNAPAATRARSDSRIRATASKDKKGRNIVILEDRDQDGLVGGEVEMLVVRKVGRKGSASRSRSASGASNITVKAKVVDEVMETVVEEKTVQEEKEEEKKAEGEEEKEKEEKVEEKVEVKKDEGEHKSDLQKEEEARRTEEKAVEQKPKAEEPTADVVPKTAAVIVIEDKEKKIQPEVVIVEVKIKEKEKDKDKGKDKDAKKASKGEDEPKPDSDELEEPSTDTTATASKEKTDSRSEKPTEVKESDSKDGKIEPVNGGEWTKEQDDRLIAMKKENKTWRNIAEELGTSKKDAVARYKILQAKEKEENCEEEQEEKTKKIEKKNKKKNIKCTARADKDEGSEDEFYIAPDCPYHHPKSKSSSSKPDKKVKTRKSYGELDKNRDDGEDEEERAQGSRDGKGHLQPDHIWSAEDCETLEYLMEKHRSTQWLQLQAGFFNYTGRMVKAEFIERKFRKDGLA